ncbi:MAG: hypothetical protein JXA90_10755 [Planctomycetes bacterium]|nr:hypothetical protein [Planctomycetota bacterium]
MSTGDSDRSPRPLPPRLSSGEAAARFSRRRGILLRRPRPVRLELVYLPVYLVEAEARERRGGSSRRLLLAVDGIDGGVSRIDHSIEFSECETPPGEVFPSLLGAADALSRAREEIPWLVLPVALRAGRAIRLRPLGVKDLVGWPYWVQHLARGRSRDFRAIDAVAGGRIGPRGRATLLRAFVRGRAEPPAA